MSDLAAFALFGGGLLAALAVGEALRAWAGWTPESSRRAVHALVGVETALSPLLFREPTWIYVLAGGFALVNLVAVPRGVFPSMHAIRRRSWGTVVFPLALMVALLLAWTLDPSRVYAMQASFLVLALADPAASFVGTRMRRPGRYCVGDQTKSVAGSAAFFVVAAVAVWCVLAAFGPEAGSLSRGGVSLTAAALATAAEALGRRGWDNLWIVLAVLAAVVAWGEGASSTASAGLGAALALGFGVSAWRLRSLDLGGALAASLLAWLVAAVGGADWTVPIFAFFVLSSGLSRLGRGRKADAEQLAEKGSRRDAGQVVANGGIAGGLLLGWLFVPGLGDGVYWAFLGALAAAAADTWATEIGTWAGGPTRRLAVGQRVPPGTSGGMSIAGTLGALAGAASVVACAIPFSDLSAPVAVGIVGGGFVGALADTVLGGTIQARYRRPSGELTERRYEEGEALPLAAGVRRIGNDAVNLLCTLCGALAAWGLGHVVA